MDPFSTYPSSGRDEKLVVYFKDETNCLGGQKDDRVTVVRPFPG